MQKQIIVIGGRGHARVVIDTLLSMGKKILGIFDEAMEIDDEVLGCRVIGKESINLADHSPDRIAIANGVGFIPGRRDRIEIFSRIKRRAFTFELVVHPSAVVGRAVHLDEGVQLFAGCVVQPGSRIGANSVVNTNASIDHDCVVGSDVHICPGTTVCGGVQIDDQVFVGSGTVITPGIRIGRGAIIGAGSTVVKDVPAFSKLVGGKLSSCP